MLRSTPLLPFARQPCSDQAENPDRIEAKLSMEPIENADAREPREAKEPMEANELAEPIDRTEPAEPIDRIDPEEPIDKIDLFDPMLGIEPLSGRDELPPLRINAFWQAPAAAQVRPAPAGSGLLSDHNCSAVGREPLDRASLSTLPLFSRGNCATARKCRGTL